MKKYINELEPKEIIENPKKGLSIESDGTSNQYFMIDNIICYLNSEGELFINASLPCYEQGLYFKIGKKPLEKIDELKGNKMSEDIFDLNDIDDLPDILRNQVGLSLSFTRKLIMLFKIADRPLTTNELTVGYYRKFNEVKTKRQIILKLNQISTGLNK